MGKLTNARGFSLIELMLTVSFVLLGTTLIQGSFLRAAEIFGRYTDTMKAMVWMNQECARTKEELLYSEGGEPANEGGTVEISGKSFPWSRDVLPAGGPNLYAIRMSMRWTESGKPVDLKSEWYAYKKDISAAG